MAKTQNYYGAKLDLMSQYGDEAKIKADLGKMTPEELAQLRAEAEQRRRARTSSNSRPNKRAAGMNTTTPPPASGSLRDYGPSTATGLSPEAQRYASRQKVVKGLKTTGKVGAAIGAGGLAAAGIAALPGDLEDKAMVAGGGAAAAGAWQGYKNRDRIAQAGREWMNARGERKASLQRELDAYNNGDYKTAQAERDARMGKTEAKTGGIPPEELRDKPKPKTYDMNAQQRAEMGRADEMHSEAKQRYDRLDRQLKQAGNVKNPDAKYMEGLRTQLNAAQADMDAAVSLRDEVRAQPRGKSTFDEAMSQDTKTGKAKSAGKAAGQVGKETMGAATAGAEAVSAKIKEEAPRVAEKIKNGTASTGEKMQNAVNKAWSKTKDVAGRMRPGGSAKADATIEAEATKSMPADMDPNAKKSFAKKFRITAGRMMYVPALYDMGRSFADRAEEIGTKAAATEFLNANIDMLKETYDEVSQIEDAGDFFNFVGDTAIGLVGGFLSSTSNGMKYMANDMMALFGSESPRFDTENPWDWTRAAPEAAAKVSGVTNAGGVAPIGYQAPPQQPSGFQGVQPMPTLRSQPTSPEAAPPAPPPPTLAAGDQSLPAAYQDPQISLSQQGDTGRFGITGKNGGIGVMDATNAAGGIGGFRDRVNESMKAGAYNPVSDARRQQGLRDLEQVRRGTDAIRELSASRLGVPVEYLDAVRSGQLSRREAALLGARDGGLRARYGDTPAEMMTAQAAMQNANAKAQDARTGQIEAGQTFMQNAGQNLAVQAFPNDPEKQAQYGARFQNFAESKLPKGTPFHLLEAPQQAEIMGEFALADYLSRKGEGWLRSLNPFAPDITAETMAGTGQSILESMRQQGTMFDIGDDNKVFAVRDSSGRPVTVKGEMEDMPPAARNYIEQFISRLPPEERARRGGLRSQ